ncbi:helix-turn-helix domain-containing protein [Gluconobacter wancherniae]|uniref:helix-turn-helix domain-containing protein n=1 Tax=Gluconobacter wancherniae TaxID=1307955 RepID=UPI001B8B40C2|nr:helix-turn-helix domain-containing protein [Gluconobacter wancherniae]MBS1089934.1 helix-turn-helix domain-containing protein [Gluconobacter wancherniae]
MSFASQIWTLTQAHKITGKAHIVLMALASFQGHKGLFPSHESIASRAGCSVRTVIRSLETAYSLGIVERTRQRIRRSGRVVNGPNRYRLLIAPMEQAKASARHLKQQLQDALNRRKARLSSKCQNASGDNSQSNLFYENRSPSEWLDILNKMNAGMSAEEAGYHSQSFKFRFE